MNILFNWIPAFAGTTVVWRWQPSQDHKLDSRSRFRGADVTIAEKDS